MYNELYAAWQREIDDPTLGALPLDFYAKIAEYLRRIKEEDKVLDKKSVKMNLLEHEAANVERMLKELLGARYRKIIKTVTKTQKLPSELLTTEEAKMCETFADFTKAYQKFAENLMQGTNSPNQPKSTIKVEVQNRNSPNPQTVHYTILKEYSSHYGRRHEIVWSVCSGGCCFPAASERPDFG